MRVAVASGSCVGVLGRVVGERHDLRPFEREEGSLTSGRELSEETDGMPDQLNPRHIRRRLVQLAAAAALITAVLLAAPGLGEVRTRLAHASPGWLMLAVGFEVLSVFCYVVIFRTVFCPRMGWRFSSEIAMSELAANAILPVSGAGGLALGAWALRRGGMDVEEIGRKTVALFLLTSLANVTIVIVFAFLYAVGALGRDPDPALSDLFGALSVAAVLAVVALPSLLRRIPRRKVQADGRVGAALALAHRSLVDGVPDAKRLLRRRSGGVLLGSFGTTVCDLAVLGFAFKAIGVSVPIGVLALGYLIGMLGGNVPVPGGIGGVDGGLIGALTLFGEPLAASTVAVLTYHAISLWVPALMGSVAFVRLRAKLQREQEPAAICMPLLEPLEAV
jgi:uncharacterized membrane protein YbhN (UPF0104 family)